MSVARQDPTVTRRVSFLSIYLISWNFNRNSFSIFIQSKTSASEAVACVTAMPTFATRKTTPISSFASADTTHAAPNARRAVQDSNRKLGDNRKVTTSLNANVNKQKHKKQKMIGFIPFFFQHAIVFRIATNAITMLKSTTSICLWICTANTKEAVCARIANTTRKELTVTNANRDITDL